MRSPCPEWRDIAEAYVAFLATGEEIILKPFLTCDFTARRKAVEQIKLILRLPRLFSGFGMEVHLLTAYPSEPDEKGNEIVSPFQFDVTYSRQPHQPENEKSTMTLHQLIFDGHRWKIAALIGEDDLEVLRGLVAKLEAKPTAAAQF